MSTDQEPRGRVRGIIITFAVLCALVVGVRAASSRLSFNLDAFNPPKPVSPAMEQAIAEAAVRINKSFVTYRNSRYQWHALPRDVYQARGPEPTLRQYPPALDPSTWGEPVHRITATVLFEPDQGQQGGTLLHVTNDRGDLMFAAGWHMEHNRGAAIDRRQLQVYTAHAQREPEIERLPNPFPKTSGATLVQTPHGIGAITVSNCASELMEQHLQPDGTWLGRELPKDFAEYQPVGMDGWLLFTTTEAFYGTGPDLMEARPIYTTSDPRIAEARKGQFYHDGTLFVAYDHHRPAHGVFWHAIPWTPDMLEPASLDAAPVCLVDGLQYRSFGVAHAPDRPGDAVFLTTAGGAIAAWDGADFALWRSGGEGLRITVPCTVRVGDRTLMCQQPRGYLAAIAPDRVDELAVPAPEPDEGSAPKRSSDVAAHYNGELWTGLWPWGMLARLQPRDAEEGLVLTHGQTIRLFAEPDIGIGGGVFGEELMRTLGYADGNDLLGQHISSILPLGEDLYVATSTSTCQERRIMGYVGAETFREALGEERFLQYGAVYRLHMDGNLAIPFRWPSAADLVDDTDDSGLLTEIEFLVSSTEVVVRRDGAEIGRMTIEHPTELDFHALSVGEGIYGPFRAGEVLHVEHEIVGGSRNAPLMARRQYE